MNKFVKMSLAASVAVAGFASTASAKDLSEAIKNVDISGSIVYRYDDYKSDSKDGGVNADRNKYKMVVNVASKVNDDVTANVSVIAGNGSSNDMYSSKTGSEGDENLDIELSQVNFDYTAIKNTSIKIGKQGIDTPFTMAVDSDGDTQTGTGIVANTTWYGVTAIAGYFNQTNFDDSASSGAKSGDDKDTGIYGGEEDVIIAGLASSVGPVALSAWYMGLEDDKTSYTVGGSTNSLVDSSFDAYTLNANYPFALGPVKMNLDARYSNLEFDSEDAQTAVGGKAGTTENEFWKLALSGKYGIFGASVAYGQTGSDGGYTSVDSSSKATWSGWNADANGVADAEIMLANVNADIYENINLALNYHDVDSDYKDSEDHTDTFAQLTYKMSNNFKTYVRYGQFTETNDSGKEIDSDTGRLQVEYTF